MKNFFQILFVAAVLMTSALAMAAEFGGDYFEAEGVVYPDGKKSNPNALRRLAIMDAYRYLAEEVDALNVTSTSTVKNLRDLDDEINTRVEAVLHGAKVISVKREADGSFHAIVRMPTHGPQSIAGAVLKENIVVEDFPKPRFTNMRSEVTNYTGIVIDCRGMNLSTAVAPVIKSVGGLEIYAYKNLGYQTAVDKGMVEYSTSLESARGGATPLVIKAVSISNCDVVVSEEDADRILYANQTTNVLSNCAVVFVR